VEENGIIKKELLTNISEATISSIHIDSLYTNNYFQIGGLNLYILTQTLVDESYIDLPVSSIGFGTIQIGNNQERVNFSYSSDGVVTIIQKSLNVSNSDLDSNLCVFDNGENVRIKNNLGSTLVLRINITLSN
jgi:hypothetical protein